MVDKDGDEQSRKRLWSLIGLLSKKQLGTFEEKDAPTLISEVHELNMEQFIRIQAKNFYDEFPFKELKDQLIADFTVMEHCRRRDDFEGFSLAAFQQIENITNNIFIKMNIWSKAIADKDLQMFTSINKEKETKRYGFTLGSQIVYSMGPDKEKTIREFFNKPAEKVDFVPKFKLILYFSYFNERIKTSDEWNQVFNLGYDIYLSRNRNHRGAINTESQARKQEQITKGKYKYYLLFLGYLADFVQKVSSTYGVLEKG